MFMFMFISNQCIHLWTKAKTSIKILTPDSVKFRLQIKETLVIHDCAAFDSFNVIGKSFECKLW